jgi:protein-S-isoprenylcysteine O-methyltransferase
LEIEETMNRTAVFFLTILTPLLAALLALLGWMTLPVNMMGGFLLLTGVVYFAGILVVYWMRKVPFWNPKKGGRASYEEKGDLSFWLILPGMIVSFFISPVEFLYMPVLIPRTLVYQIAGLALVGISSALFIWARRSTRGNYSGHLMTTASQKLVRSGPYRFVRHPAYASYLLMSLGVALGYSSLIGIGSVLILLLPAMIYRIQVEEKLLVEQFGQCYLDYAVHTARLIPGIW